MDDTIRMLLVPANRRMEKIRDHSQFIFRDNRTSLRNHVDSLHFRGNIARTKLFIKMADFSRKTRHRQLFCKRQ